MNARQRAFARYCEEREEYIGEVMVQMKMSWDQAVDYCLLEDEEYYRALFHEELAREDLTAGE